MRVLVTGSNGRIGKILVSKLLEAGHKVTGFDLVDPEKIEDNFQFVKGSLEDFELLKKNLKSQGAVIHLGAFMSWNDADNPRIFSCNVQGTFNLLEGLDKKNLLKLIFISSGEVYPEGNPQYLPVDEHHPTLPTSFYGASKLLGEEVVRYYTRRYSIPSVILRISHTQNAEELLNPESFFSGPRFFLKPKIKRFKELDRKQDLDVLLPFDTGTEKLVLSRGYDGRPYMMHITETRDIVEGILLALETSVQPGEIFNLGSDEPINFETAIPEMSKLTGLEIIDVRLAGPAVHYVTSNRKARYYLNYSPKWTLSKMLDEAIITWKRRQS